MRERDGGRIVDEAENVRLDDVTGAAPKVTYEKDGETRTLACDFIAGCDGFHGVSRQSIPAKPDANLRARLSVRLAWRHVRNAACGEVIYARHARGFALASLRNPMLSRYYIQCGLDTDIADWPDDRFWDELKRRFPPEIADKIVTGPVDRKVNRPLAKLRRGADAIRPPLSCRRRRAYRAADGAKGLNLAISDVFYLQRALIAHFRNGDDRYLDSYSDMALRRVWGAVRLSWQLTKLLHVFPDEDAFETRIKTSEFDYLHASPNAQAALAEQYAGLPFED